MHDDLHHVPLTTTDDELTGIFGPIPPSIKKQTTPTPLAISERILFTMPLKSNISNIEFQQEIPKAAEFFQFCIVDERISITQ